MAYDDKPVSANDKSIILAKTDVNQLFPLKYKWAWEHFLNANHNHWTPQDIPMGPDVALWKGSNLSEAHRNLFLGVLAQLTTFDIQRGRDVSESLSPIICAPELKIFIHRQAYEEALHTWSYQTCIENLGIPEEDIYNRYRTVEILRKRVEYADRWSQSVEKLDGELLNFQGGKEQLFLGLVFWYLFFEGVWFALNLAGPIQALARRGLFQATSEHFIYILRDETLHIEFGIDLINTFKEEYPSVWNESTKHQILDIAEKVLELEIEFIKYCIPKPIVEYSVSDHIEMTMYYINRRLASIGFDSVPYPAAKCVMPWMNEMIIFKKETAFFERRVTEYRKGAINFDDIDSGIDLDTDWFKN